ncbi:carbohydrate ABC transporter permease [Paenibacillus methanolicus]|uniref:Raffinose/stachyose/melibiose transport system permease protein n=1 Tax=Paenibacillus methanolicus TaxID=582686 RepID=A0A5S5CKA7_9BACL|nr:sugar ABC transporter permease [Paenibacillus methanolicus]TYP79165.1 raffinose/stachyose/melibiose transport system permease protein [Paenibacillus methanolicus]
MKAGKRIALFFVPGLTLYAALFLYPTITGFYYSLTNWDGISPSYDFVGLSNYRELTEHIIFRKALVNNVKFMLFVVLVQTGLSLLLALRLARNTKRNVALRALYFVPTVLSSVSVALIWTFVFDPTQGLANGFLSGIGLGSWTQNWLGDTGLAIFSVAAVQAWAHIGQMVILFVAGLQAIPKELIEAARLDGAGALQIFRRVTWPLLAPAAALVVSYTTIQSFKAFDLIFTMTGGGPVYSTEILSTFIYNTAFSSYTFGLASAGSVFFLALIAVITYVQFRVIRADRVAY